MLFDKTIEFYDKLYRNIPAPQGAFNPFDDLSDDPVDWEYAKQHAGLQDRVIHTVFSAQRWCPSRFGNGYFPVWYGSLSSDTSVHETMYHWKNNLLRDAYLDEGFVIYSERKVFTVDCRAILMDLRHKTKECPALIQPNHEAYYETQKLGAFLHEQGLPGLLTQSVRDAHGVNAAIFKADVLGRVQFCESVRYEYDATTQQVRVC